MTTIHGPSNIPILLKTVRYFARRLNYIAQHLEWCWVGAMVEQVAGRNATRIPTYTRKIELATLYKLAAIRPIGSQAVEIGSHLGASACYLASGLNRISGHLLCIDTWWNDAMPEGRMDTFPEFLRNTHSISHILRLLRRGSYDIDASDLPRVIDFVFIDGDHSYEGARRDFALVRPAIPVGGIAAFHDGIAVPGVNRILGEALSDGSFELSGVVQSLVWLTRVKPDGAARTLAQTVK